MPGLSPFQITQGLFGGMMPSSGLSLLGDFLPSNVLSLLGPQPAGGAASSPAPTAGGPSTAGGPQPLTALSRANQVGTLLTQNAYGTFDPQKLGILASAGFPMFNDPRLTHGYLATMALNGDADAEEQLRRMLAGGGGGGWNEGGGGGPGGGGPAGSDVSGGPAGAGAWG